VTEDLLLDTHIALWLDSGDQRLRFDPPGAIGWKPAAISQRADSRRIWYDFDGDSKGDIG
jgi:hypothetical protein